MSKIAEIFFISNPNPDLHNINAHTKFGVTIYKLSSRKENRDRRTILGQTNVSTL